MPASIQAEQSFQNGSLQLASAKVTRAVIGQFYPSQTDSKAEEEKNAFQQPLQGEEDPVFRGEEEEAPIRLLKDQVKAKAILSGNVISSVYPQWIVT